MGCSDNQRKSINVCESVEIDEALNLTGYGKFHYELLVACAVCLLVVGFQNGVTAYIFPAAQCELDLDSSQLGFLNVAFLIGGTASSFFWGILADSLGRRKVLLVSHFLNAICTILLSINYHVVNLVLCRFLNGFLIGAPGSVIFSYIGEFQPPRFRSSIYCCCALFFTASWLLLPVLAWLILPINVHFVLGSIFIISPWRLFLIIIIIPEIILGFWFLRLPETPKYLLAKGKARETLIVLRRMYSQNTGHNSEKYSVHNLVCEVNTDASLSESMECRGKTARILGEVWIQVKSLFKPPIWGITLLNCSLMFTNMFGTFGLGLWLPKLFILFEQFQKLHPNESVSIQQLASLSTEKNVTCEASFDPAVIQSTVAMGVTSLVASAICGWAATKVSIKVIPFITMLVGGLSAGSIYWLSSATQNLVVACFFQGSMIVANMSISGVGVELFPTQVGAMSVCLVMCIGRVAAMLSNVLFGLFMEKHPEIPIFVVTANVLVGAILCLCIPIKNKEKLQTEAYAVENGKSDGIAMISIRNKEHDNM